MTQSTDVIALAPVPRAGALSRITLRALRGFATHVLPPLVIIAVLALIWQALGSRPGASLPPPTKVVQDTWELITQPFYDRGGNDVGIAWQLLASLKRVAYGYFLSVLAGVSLPDFMDPVTSAYGNEVTIILIAFFLLIVAYFIFGRMK